MTPAFDLQLVLQAFAEGRATQMEIQQLSSYFQTLGSETEGAVGDVEYVYASFTEPAESLLESQKPKDAWGYRRGGRAGNVTWVTTRPTMTFDTPYLLRSERELSGPVVDGGSISDEWSDPITISVFGLTDPESWGPFPYAIKYDDRQTVNVDSSTGGHWLARDSSDAPITAATLNWAQVAALDFNARDSDGVEWIDSFRNVDVAGMALGIGRLSGGRRAIVGFNLSDTATATITGEGAAKTLKLRGLSREASLDVNPGSIMPGLTEYPLYLLSQILPTPHGNAYPVDSLRTFTWEYRRDGGTYRYTPSSGKQRLETGWYLDGQLFVTTYAEAMPSTTDPEAVSVVGTGYTLASGAPNSRLLEFAPVNIQGDNTNSPVVTFTHRPSGAVATKLFHLVPKPIELDEIPKFRGRWVSGSQYLEADTVVVYSRTNLAPNVYAELPFFFVALQAHRAASGNAPTVGADNDYWAQSEGGDLHPSFGGRTISNKSYAKGQSVSEALPVAGGGNAPLTYSLSPALPAGLTFSAADRTITGTTTTAQAETAYTYTVTDSDATGPDTDTITFNITVSSTTAKPLTYSGSNADLNWNRGQVYTTTLAAAEGGVGTKTYSATGLPPGVFFTPGTRALTGTPTTNGDYTVIVTVTAGSETARDSFVVRVRTAGNIGIAPSWGSITVSDKQYLTSETVNLQLPRPDQSGGGGHFGDGTPEQHTYTVSGLPNGLTFDSRVGERRIKGTPSQLGYWTITYRVSDYNGPGEARDSASLQFKISVDITRAFGFTGTQANVVVIRGESASINLPSIQGGVRPYPPNADYISGAPPGMSRGSGGTYGISLEGTPTTAGTYTVRLQASDGAGTMISQTFTVTVQSAATVPDAPTGLSLSQLGSNGLNQTGRWSGSWTAVAGATSYEWSVDNRRRVGHTWVTRAFGSGAATSFTTDPIANWRGAGNVYDGYRMSVRARNSRGWGARAYTTPNILASALPTAPVSATMARSGTQLVATWSQVTGVNGADNYDLQWQRRIASGNRWVDWGGVQYELTGGELRRSGVDWSQSGFYDAVRFKVRSANEIGKSPYKFSNGLERT